MSRSIVLVLLLLPLLLQVPARPSDNLQTSVGIMRPVKQLPSQPRSSTEITFSDFEIQQMFVSNHPGTVEIKGEPTKGARFFARASIYAWEAIATLKFEAVDEHGNFIDRVFINREPSPDGDSDFYGVIKIPDVPFRVVMRGEGWDGKTFTRTFERLFRPTTRRQSAILIPGKSGVEARQNQLVQDYMNKMEEDVRKNAAEIIVMPRTRASNIMYAPYFSKTGRQLGIRITYDAEFSHDGYYNPELVLFLDYRLVDWRGRIEMTPLTGSIDPQPKEPGSEPQVRPNILAYGAGYLYRAGTKYHFTGEYIPDYVIQNEQKTKFCIYSHKFDDSPNLQTAFREIMEDKRPTPYTLEIKNADFFGVIEDLAPQGTLLKNFLAEGATDCGLQPTNRF